MGNAYLQIPLTEEAKAKTAFITPDTTGQFNRMMFGLTNAPYAFSRLMQIVLGPLGQEVVQWYLDDVLIAAADWPEMFRKLEEVLKAFKEANLTLKLRKCHFGLRTVEYVGHVLSENGLQPGMDKLQAISGFPRPRNVHEMRRFLGLTGYFRRFIADYGRKARTLTELTKKDKAFVWNSQEEAAFEFLKGELLRAPVLRLFNHKANRTEVHTDACQRGLASVLLQADDEEEPRPVLYISRKTSDAESRYSACKLELMAVAYALQKLRHYLIGMQFVVVTDCEAVVHMHTQRTRNSQIARWFQLLQEFDFSIRHRAGQKMVHVDALSRAPVSDPDSALDDLYDRLEVLHVITQDDKVLTMQRSDKDLCELINILKKNKSDLTESDKMLVKDYELREGKLFRRIGAENNEQLRYVLPKTMRKSICVEYHDLNGHFGLDRTVSAIGRLYWFPGMRRYVRQHIRACFKCLVTKIPGGKQPGLLHPLQIPKRPFYRVHMDHCGPLVVTRRGNGHILVIIDALTRFVRLFAVKSTKTIINLKKIKMFVECYGIPNQIVTDRGTCFTSEAFKKYCSEIGSKHTLISPRHPQSNGMVERVMKTLVPAITASLDGDFEWDEKMTEVEHYLNLGINQHTGKAPYEALMGYIPRFRDNYVEDIVIPEGQATWVPSEKMQEDIRKRVAEAQEKYKGRYDSRRWKGETYEVGDVVAMKWAPTATGQSTKLRAKYKCPFVIVEKLPNDAYRISNISEAGGRNYSTTAHVSQLKVYKNPDLEGEEEEDIDQNSEDDEVATGDGEEMDEGKPKRERKLPAKYSDYKL